MRRMIACGAVIAGTLWGLAPSAARSPALAGTATPIRHVVIIDEENHSFDNLLGRFCHRVHGGSIVRPGHGSLCSGTIFGKMPNGDSRRLPDTPDFGIEVSHDVAAQISEIDGGKMDGWAHTFRCGADTAPPYVCMTESSALSGTCGPSQHETCIPNILHWASQYTIADHVFEFRRSPSWIGHMVLGSATMDGFQGDNPRPWRAGPGVGCDSGKTALWWNGSAYRRAPSCVPDASGSLGPVWSTYTGPRATYIPTILDTFDRAGVSWKLYGGDAGEGHEAGYQWTMCPTFYECLGSSQIRHLVPANTVIGDAQSGALPAVSFVTPAVYPSMHEPQSTAAGDTWLGSIVGGIMNSSEWASTAILLTWDDYGGFYDHVNPLHYNPHYGIRLPMIVISPYAKQGYTDTTPTTVIGMLAFVEHTFGLPALNPCAAGTAKFCTDDANTYDFSNSFDFTQVPLPGVPSVRTTIPPGELAWLRAHPDAADQPS